MKIKFILFVMFLAVAMLSCAQRGVLKEVILGDIHGADTNHVIRFTTPTRGKFDHDWGYILSFVTNEKISKISGKYVIRDKLGNIQAEGDFDNSSLLESSWYSDKSKFSYLFSEKFMLKNHTNYTLELIVDYPSGNNFKVCLHFLDLK